MIQSFRSKKLEPSADSKSSRFLGKVIRLPHPNNIKKIGATNLSIDFFSKKWRLIKNVIKFTTIRINPAIKRIVVFDIFTFVFGNSASAKILYQINL